MKTTSSPNATAAAQPGQLRIIAGKWKSRFLRFQGSAQLRPTPDAVRETLFNWLQDNVAGARCLDLFAGSGALGFEAASRGAVEVVMVENHRVATRALKANREKLKADNIHIVQDDVIRYLRNQATAHTNGFDIVFIDPPYAKNLIEPVTQALLHGWLRPQALVYVETESSLTALPVPSSWQLIRSQKKGEVGYHLCRTTMLSQTA